MRQPVLIKNTNKFGKATNKWYVRIGKEWKLFSQEEWENGGIAWVNQRLLTPAVEREGTA